MPLSPEPRKRARQLANLRSAPPAPRGNRRGVEHGGYAEIARDRLEEKQRQVFDALSADAPLRDARDELPRHDAAQVALLGEVLCRLDDVNAYLSARGYLDEGILHRHYQSFRRNGDLRYSLWEPLSLEMWLRKYWS